MNNQSLKNINKARKFHDAWAFILYTMLYVGCTTYTVLNIKETKMEFGLESAEIKHGLFCLATVTIFILLNFGGLSLFPEFFLKSTIALFPFITITLAIISLNIMAFLFAILSLIAWGIFVYYYWSKLKYIGVVLKFIVSILLKNIFTVFFGIILCSSLLILQLILTLSLDFNEIEKNLLLHILIIFNLFWSMSNFVYFYNVYSTSIVAYHFIDFHNTSRSVFSGAIKNSIYALGSISFAGFIVAIVNTLKYFVQRERNARRESRESNLIADILLCITQILLSVLEEIIEFANELTLPYLAIHGEGYIQSMKNAYKLIVSNPFPSGGLVALRYSLGISALLVSSICTGSFFYTIYSIKQSIEVDRIIKIVILTFIPLVFYFTTMMVISSSFLGLIYFSSECPDLVREVDSEIEVNLKEC